MTISIIWWDTSQSESTATWKLSEVGSVHNTATMANSSAYFRWHWNALSSSLWRSSIAGLCLGFDFSLVQNYKFRIQFKLVSTPLRVHTFSFWTTHIIGNRLNLPTKERKSNVGHYAGHGYTINILISKIVFKSVLVKLSILTLSIVEIDNGMYTCL